MEQALPIIIVLPNGEQHPGEMPQPPVGAVRGPLVSCLMVTRGSRPAIALAIECYRRQSYVNRELVIVCDRPRSLVEPLLARLADPTIRLHLTDEASLGELRNIAVAQAAGQIVCQWDDDDLCHPRRLELQLAALAGRDAAASFMLRWMIWQPARRRLAVSSGRLWEGSILADRAAMIEYPPLACGEDREMVERLRTRHRLVAIDAPLAYCYIIHDSNTCPTTHFEQLFANATQSFAGEAYDGTLAALAQVMPIDAMLAQLTPQ